MELSIHSNSKTTTTSKKTLQSPREIRKRIDRNKARRDAQGKKTTSWNTNVTMVKCSRTLLKKLVEQEDGEIKKNKLIEAVRAVNLGRRLRRTQRQHRRKALAAAAALYHVIANSKAPEATLESIVKSTKVVPPRGADNFRTIVECCFDYGTTPEERIRNRQYAASDANALRYIVRNKMDPNEVEKDQMGESPTKWAKMELEFQAQSKGKKRRSETSKPKTSAASKHKQSKLTPIRLNGARYKTLQAWSEKGLVVAKPPGDGRPLTILVVPLQDLTFKQAKGQPGRIIAILRKAIDELTGTSAKGGHSSPASARQPAAMVIGKSPPFSIGSPKIREA